MRTKQGGSRPEEYIGEEERKHIKRGHIDQRLYEIRTGGSGFTQIGVHTPSNEGERILRSWSLRSRSFFSHTRRGEESLVAPSLGKTQGRLRLRCGTHGPRSPLPLSVCESVALALLLRDDPRSTPFLPERKEFYGLVPEAAHV